MLWLQNACIFTVVFKRPQQQVYIFTLFLRVFNTMLKFWLQNAYIFTVVLKSRQQKACIFTTVFKTVQYMFNTLASENIYTLVLKSFKYNCNALASECLHSYTGSQDSAAEHIHF
jgi:hypothetical protein